MAKQVANEDCKVFIQTIEQLIEAYGDVEKSAGTDNGLAPSGLIRGQQGGGKTRGLLTQHIVKA